MGTLLEMEVLWNIKILWEYYNGILNGVLIDYQWNMNGISFFRNMMEYPSGLPFGGCMEYSRSSFKICGIGVQRGCSRAQDVNQDVNQVSSPRHGGTPTIRWMLLFWGKSHRSKWMTGGRAPLEETSI